MRSCALIINGKYLKTFRKTNLNSKTKTTISLRQQYLPIIPPTEFSYNKMWSESGAAMPSVLIVENGTGEVFIIENKSSESLMDRILKSPRARKMPVIKFETREASPVDLK